VVNRNGLSNLVTSADFDEVFSNESGRKLAGNKKPLTNNMKEKSEIRHEVRDFYENPSFFSSN